MPHACLVQDPEALKEGDHIKWKRLPGYDHHAIVESVESGKVNVIEYGSDKGGSGFGEGVVRRHTVDDVKRMYKYIYDECDDASQVLQRAKERLGERKYNPFNNCEHFATWCKTGEKECTQIGPFFTRAATEIVTCVSGGCATVVGRCVAKCAVDAVKNTTTIPTQLKCMLTCGGPKTVYKAVSDAVAQGGKVIGKNALKAGCKVGTLAITSVVSEACIFGYSCYKAHKTYENKKDRNTAIKEAAFEAVGGAIGGTVLGAAIGSVIPVAGTAVGALLGNIGGRIFGRILARLLLC